MEMASVTEIQFRELPHQSRLFLSYIDKSPSALQFYRHPPTLQGLEEAAHLVLETARTPRTPLAEILRRQNEAFGSDAATLDRIGELEKPDCVAIVTGQQAGLFTGPLYTVFKAMTAIRIADGLRDHGINAVPVFWMETEDHDLAEVTRRTAVRQDGSVATIDFGEMLFGPGIKNSNASVGSVRFTDKIIQAVEEYLRSLPEGRGKHLVAADLEFACRPGISFADSFGKLMARLFQGSGLILFDPRASEAKRLNSRVFEMALRRESEIRAALVKRSAELENSGFHSQVGILDNSTVLFLIDGGERRALERRGSHFGLKNTDRTFSLEELLERATRNPEQFSPNVLLRPIIQDHLFPTAAYIGGAAEVAYLAQAETLYRIYGAPMPVIWPRNSFTLIDPETATQMKDFGIEFADLLTGRQALLDKMLRSIGSAQLAGKVDELKALLEDRLAGIKTDLQNLESPLAQALETARRKIMHNVQRLSSQAIRVEESRNSSIARTIDFLLNTLYPNMTLQERELGIQYFLAGQGPDVLNKIHAAADPFRFTHGLIRL